MLYWLVVTRLLNNSVEGCYLVAYYIDSDNDRIVNAPLYHFTIIMHLAKWMVLLWLCLITGLDCCTGLMDLICS